MRKSALLLLTLFLCSCSSEPKMVSPPNPIVEQLSAMLGTEKFGEDDVYFYPGCPNPELRRTLNATMDDVIRQFIDLAEKNATKEQDLDLLKRSIRRFDRNELDSEECDRIGLWFERIMDCVGLESSEGALNTWRYGWFTGRLLEHLSRRGSRDSGL